MTKVCAVEPLYRKIDLFPWQIPDKWDVVDDPRHCDWLLIKTSSTDKELREQQEFYQSLKLPDRCKIMLVNVWWIADEIDTEIYISNELEKYSWLNRPIEYLHTNRSIQKGFYDILWNRHKFYYTDRGDPTITTHWTEGHTAEMYELWEIPTEKICDKIYLSPNRLYQDHLSHSERLQRRQQLVQHLDTDRTWISSSEQHLPAQQYSDYLWQKITLNRDSIWQPIHNSIYAQSYCSVYVETLVGRGETRSVTEKTFDPLIKGHFILPYAYYGFRQDLLGMGFVLPPELDLHYLDIKDSDQRWQAFLCEVDRNLLRDWPSFYRENRDLLLHNRRLFWNRPYSRIPL